jgi:phosphatidylinositol glycan class U
VRASLLCFLLALPVAIQLLGQPKSGLANPKSISVDFKKWRIPGDVVDAAPRVSFEHSAYDLSVNSRSLSNKLSLPDLTPNPGLWWYFFTEIFDRFRPSFLMAFSLVCIKFPYDPLYVPFILTGVLGTVKAYPTFSDPGLLFTMVSLSQRSFRVSAYIPPRRPVRSLSFVRSSVPNCGRANKML